ncbi:MAG: D-aminoacyl-tRNA deacylase [Bryobacteraceae bacterium]
MRALIQRVGTARVEVDGQTVAQIGAGLLVFLGVAKSDTRRDADYLADKVAGLRIFPDQDGRMNRSLVETGGSILVVSQFTLYADVSRGRRPGFEMAADPRTARQLYEYFVEALQLRGLPVQTGVFQAHMAVHLVNDGPVTLLIDSGKNT